jgi:hypothetical protein
MSKTRWRGTRLIKVPPAERDFERLKPHLKPSIFEDAAPRWQSAAKLDSTSVEFQDNVYRAIIYLLFRSIAALHTIRPDDRKHIGKLLRRERSATQLIAEACRLYGSGWGAAPREMEWALFVSIYRQATLENAAAQLKKMPLGRPRYRAFETFARQVAEAYKSASNRYSIVKIDYARSVAERCSGPFAELLETAYKDAVVIWNRAGFETAIDGPRDRNARLEYARKVVPRE